jgi:hypothetical protein
MKSLGLMSAIPLATCFISGSTPLPYCHPVRPPIPECASVVIAQRTDTGHEADMPIRLCGMPIRGTWTCDVVSGPLQANAKLECSQP